MERGLESPRLAALLLQKYGIGIADAAIAIYDNFRVADVIYDVLDEEVAKIQIEKHIIKNVMVMYFQI